MRCICLYKEKETQLMQMCGLRQQDVKYMLGIFLALLSPLTWSAVQTMPYIATHTQPKYTHLKVMPYANATAPKGGALSRASQGTFDNLNSMNGRGTETQGVNYLFDTLMDPSLDEPGVLYPLLAERVTFDVNQPKDIIFHLNPQARFSNSMALTAEDVKYTFDLYQQKSNLGLQMYLSDLVKTEVISKYTVKMTFKNNKNVEMPRIVATLPIYSSAEWKKRDFSKATLQPILGSGPYVIDRIDAGRSIRYKRNPNYWGRTLPVNMGRYNFDTLTYVYYRNNEVAFEGFKSGQYTLHEELFTRTWVTGYNFPAVTAGMVKKIAIKTAKPVATQTFVMNNRRSPFNDIHFRQAISYAYDFEWMNKALFYGQYQRLQSYFQNSELAATGTPSPTEMLFLKPILPRLNPVQRQAVLAEWKAPVSDASGFNRKNLLEARQILLKAGYRYHNGLLLDLNNKPIRIEFLLDPEKPQQSVIPFVRNLKKLGISVSIRQVDVPQYLERKRKADFDMTMNEMPQSLTPGNEQMQMWGSHAANEVGNYNYAGIRNAVIDQAIQEVIDAPNRQQLIIQTKILDRLLRSGYYQILTGAKDKTWLAYWNIYQQPSRQARLSIGLDYWWVDAMQAQKVSRYLRKP